MKKWLFLFVLISQTVLAQKYSGDSWADVERKGSGTLGVVYYPQAGLIYEENGKMKGVCAELLTEFATFVQTKYQKNVTVKYLGAETVFNDFLNVCQNTPNILGVTNVTITDERKRILKFTPAFLTNQETLITHKDAPTVDNLKSISKVLGGYSAKVISGSVHVKYMEQLKKTDFPSLAIAYGPSGPEILKEIASNPKLFTILDFTEYVDATRRQVPIKRQNVAIGAPQDLAFAMARQNDWDKIWQAFLTPEFRKSEKYRKIIAANLGGAYLSVLK